MQAARKTELKKCFFHKPCAAAKKKKKKIIRSCIHPVTVAAPVIGAIGKSISCTLVQISTFAHMHNKTLSMCACMLA